MRILLLHPNYHSGGAEIAGNWPPAWVAYLAGALKTAGYHRHPLHRRHDRRPRRRAARARSSREAKPGRHRRDRHHALDLQGRARAADRQGGAPRAPSPCWAASTPPSCTSRCWARRPGSTPSCAARARRSSSNLVRAVDEGRWPAERADDQAASPICDGRPRSSPRRPRRRSRISTPSRPDWGILEWEKYIYIPLGMRVAIPNMARGCPFTC